MKKYLSLPLLVLVSVFFTACTSSTTPPSHNSQTPSATEEIAKESVETEEVAQDYVGLTTEEAEALAESNGVDFRVVKRDGEFLPATLDYRIGRINAAVEDDVVVSYDVEGQEDLGIADIIYDQESWKEIIPSTCESFFDGCNTCRQLEGSDQAACTRKFCQKYEQPRCLDGEEPDADVLNGN